jgi:catechol 2,3-dioxygenase-like lactoylglutathione lyase family enzyme
MAVLDQLNIVTADLDATIAFYRLLEVELGEPARTREGRAFHVNGGAGPGATLEADSADFARAWNPGWANEERLAGRVVVGLRVAGRADVDRLAAAAVRAGHRLLQQPHDAFWGARYAIVEDPDGVAVGLMSPRDGSHSAPPPF